MSLPSFFIWSCAYWPDRDKVGPRHYDGQRKSRAATASSTTPLTTTTDTTTTRTGNLLSVKTRTVRFRPYVTPAYFRYLVFFASYLTTIYATAHRKWQIDPLRTIKREKPLRLTPSRTLSGPDEDSIYGYGSTDAVEATVSLSRYSLAEIRYCWIRLCVALCRLYEIHQREEDSGTRQVGEGAVRWRGLKLIR